ncbi:MAG: S1 RNA-binding domain-containing protein, partial [Anaerolineae bacterium]|nr:S1 RNA-binding domain-containing protein [Anaerolineae bacterium]
EAEAEAETEAEAEASAAAEIDVVEAEAEAVEPGEPTEMTMADWLEQQEAADAAPKIRRGDILEGVVAHSMPTEILIDVGAKAEGIVSGRELEQMDRETLETLKPGTPVTVYVLRPEGPGGAPVLSLSRAQEEQDWREAEAYFESQAVYESKVNGYNKGGLIVRFGRVRGFVPASQISAERRRRTAGSTPNERWGPMVGDDIMIKVVEVDRARNRLILSERAAMTEWRKRKKEELLQDLNVGEVREGRVISIADFGVFVDLGGADGLVHLTELTWRHIVHPKEIVRIGQKVRVKVISVDRERRRIGLSMKQLEEDPWDTFAHTFEINQLVQGKITKLTKFGAFSHIIGTDGVEGLIHISELSDARVGHPREVVQVGDVLTLRIIKFDAEERRLGLSLKQVTAPRFADFDWQFEPPAETDLLKDDDEDEGEDESAGAEDFEALETVEEFEADAAEDPVTEDAEGA